MPLPSCIMMLEVGDEVFWNDPEGITSSMYTITEICTTSGTLNDEFDVVRLQNNHSNTEAYACELT